MGLLPCPFCGSDGKMVSVDSRSWWVECRGCEVEGRSQHFEDDAIAAWNRRAANAATTPALLALARLGAVVVRDYFRVEGFIRVRGPLLDSDAAHTGVIIGGQFAPGIANAIAALLAPDGTDGADGAGEVSDA